MNNTISTRLTINGQQVSHLVIAGNVPEKTKIVGLKKMTRKYENITGLSM